MLLVIGGNSRKIGKSSVVEGIIRTFPEARWTALKITKQRHGSEQNTPFHLQEESDPRQNTDSGRYLRAGAARSFWLTVARESLASAVPEILRLVEASGNTIIESTSVMDHLSPDLFLMVIDDSIVEWKDSAQQHISAADGVVLVSRASSKPGGLIRKSAEAKVFAITPPSYLSSELIEWIRNKMVVLSERRRPNSEN